MANRTLHIFCEPPLMFAIEVQADFDFSKFVYAVKADGGALGHNLHIPYQRINAMVLVEADMPALEPPNSNIIRVKLNDDSRRKN